MKKNILTICVFFCIIIFFSGCIADQQGKILQSIPPISVNVPLPPQIDTTGIQKEIGGLRSEIQTSSNNTANQFSGLLNANVSKLAEKLNGVEANLSELVKINATVNNNANIELKNKLELMATVLTNIKFSMENILSMSATVNSQIGLLNDLTLKLEKLELSINANANAQVGFNNNFEQKLEKMNANAGRDVNMFPKQAVYTILIAIISFVLIFLLLGIVSVIVITNSYRSSRQREMDRTNMEREEKKHFESLLLKAMSMLPDAKSAAMAREIKNTATPEVKDVEDK